MTRHNQRVRRPPNPALPPVSAARAPAPSQPHFILRGLGNGPCPNFRPRLWPHCFGWWPHIMPDLVLVIEPHCASPNRRYALPAG